MSDIINLASLGFSEERIARIRAMIDKLVMDVESLGFSEERLGRIRPIIDKYISDDKIAGAVTLVARKGEIVHFESTGFADRESKTAMQNDNIFRIYSMTKPITCVAAMMLHEGGTFMLADPVSKFIPAFADLKVYVSGEGDDIVTEPLARPVQMRDLFTHTSGLTYHFTEYGAVEQLYRDTNLFEPKPLSEMVDAICELPLAFQPGTRFRYSVGHDVLGYIVELISGVPFDQFLKEQIFEPLKMVDTGFWVPEEDHYRFASMYGGVTVDEPDTSIMTWYGSVMSGVNRKLAGATDGRQSQPHNDNRGGGGLVSTTNDYYRFAQMMLNGGELDGAQILGRKTVELMRTNQLLPHQMPWEIGNMITSGYGFGLGMSVLTDLGQAMKAGSVGSYGWGGAANTNFWIDPEEELIGIIMTQFQPSGYFASSADFQTAVYQALVD